MNYRIIRNTTNMLISPYQEAYSNPLVTHVIGLRKNTLTKIFGTQSYLTARRGGHERKPPICLVATIVAADDDDCFYYYKK